MSRQFGCEVRLRPILVRPYSLYLIYVLECYHVPRTVDAQSSVVRLLPAPPLSV
jgi:hypothetical protein